MLLKSYSNLSMTTPDCHPGSPIWCANFQLDADISHLFPYINAVGEDADYHEEPRCIIFVLDKVRFSLYPDKASAAPFIDRNQAVEKIGHLIRFLNDLEDRKDAITPSHKKYRAYVPVLEIYKLLPRTNCKKCHFSTCMAFAAALAKREVGLDQCPDFQDANNENTAKLKSMFS